MSRSRSSRRTSGSLRTPLRACPPRSCTSSHLVRPSPSSFLSQRTLSPRTEEPTSDVAVADPYGGTPVPYAYNFSSEAVTQAPGGTFKIVDSSKFAVSTTIAVAEITVEPGALRELHWHPTEDEWAYFLEGEARVTIFGGESNANTFDFQPGDIGYVPASFGHYVENVGNTTLRFLEVFNTDHYEDVSLSQWLAVTPPSLLKAHLGWNDTTIAHLNKTKPVVAAPYSP